MERKRRNKRGVPFAGMGMFGGIFGARKNRFSKMHDKLHNSMDGEKEKTKPLKPVDPRDSAPPATPPPPPGKPVENKKEE
tara:strand:+ start:343 stop:582 length:240 start_codon:yes stop_codon:yes gene_type:complete